MRKISKLTAHLLLITALFVSALPAHSQTKPSIGNETPGQKIKRMQWWTDARFGMFIHWGWQAFV